MAGESQNKSSFSPESEKRIIQALKDVRAKKDLAEVFDALSFDEAIEVNLRLIYAVENFLRQLLDKKPH